jgi:hypothetical protein
MLMTLERSAEEVEAGREANRLDHYSNLQSVLGDGRDWEYRGEMYEDNSRRSKCSCGHPNLLYVFTIHNLKTGGTAVVGSTCIEHYGTVNPAMVNAIAAEVERIKKAAGERKRAAKALLLESEIQALTSTLNDLHWTLTRTVAGGGYGRRVNRELWGAGITVFSAQHTLEGYTEGATHPRLRVPQYKVKGALIRWLKREIDWITQQTVNPFDGWTNRY